MFVLFVVVVFLLGVKRSVRIPLFTCVAIVFYHGLQVSLQNGLVSLGASGCPTFCVLRWRPMDEDGSCRVLTFFMSSQITSGDVESGDVDEEAILSYI